MNTSVGLGACALSLMVAVSSCVGGTSKPVQKEYVITTTEITVPAKDSVPEYTIIDKTQVDLASFPQDKDGYYTLFDGKTFYGWRGYLRDDVPGRWVIEDGAIKFGGSGGGEAQEKDGGDLIFAHKFKNFELKFDWKVAKGSNSGILYLAQEIKGQPIYISSPEYQILDNANHPDAKEGENGNRQSASLYDMIPAVPQNSKAFEEWNTASITVFKGSVFHAQNGKTVVEYHLWTPKWTELLQASKFSQTNWPLAFELLNNLGGKNHEGYIGLQDHGDNVWYRNIKIKILD
ncbi:MAG: DUF1080 domain-containing protein [Tannerella sp.]|nr:DUF1080 domain-containing protein [Tannerella sp.]